jgi:uncharacterized protein YdgA (DUF945 family)
LIKKFRLIVIAVLVAALYPGIAWLIGFAIESRIGLSPEELNAQTPYVTVVDQHYRRGWYSSEQDLTLALTGPLPPLPALPGAATPTPTGLRLTIHSVIHHGPICGFACLGLARIESRLVLPDALQAAVARLYGTAPPLSIDSRLGFLGGGTTRISSPALKDAALDGGSRMNWGGLQSTLTYTRQNQSMTIHGSIPSLELTSANGSRVELHTMVLDSARQRILPLLYAGNIDFAIGSIAFTGPRGTNPTTIALVHYVVKTTTEAGFMDTTSQLSAGAISSAALRLQGVHLDLTFTHLQIEALQALNKNIQAFNRQPLGASALNTGPLLAAIRGPATDLLLNQPALKLDRISIVTQNGQVLLTGVVRLNGLVAADLDDGADPRALLQRIAADIDVSADDAALADLPGAGAAAAAQLGRLAQDGFVQHDPGVWRAKLHYEHGALSVNGKPYQPGAPQPGAPQPGAPQPGAPQPGAPHPPAPQPTPHSTR